MSDYTPLSNLGFVSGSIILNYTTDLTFPTVNSNWCKYNAYTKITNSTALQIARESCEYEAPVINDKEWAKYLYSKGRNDCNYNDSSISNNSAHHCSNKLIDKNDSNYPFGAISLSTPDFFQ